MGRRVLRFDGPLGRGSWYRPSGDEFYNSAPRNGKPYNRAFGAWKYTPFGTFGTTFPPEGELLAVLCNEVLMIPKAERRADFPLRGKWCVSTKRGAFPTPAGRFACFPSPARAVVRFSLPKAAYILIAAKGGDTTTLSGAADVKPKNPRGESPVNLKNLFLSCFREHSPSAV